jgi:hypothetical protein
MYSDNSRALALEVGTVPVLPGGGATAPRAPRMAQPLTTIAVVSIAAAL